MSEAETGARRGRGRKGRAADRAGGGVPAARPRPGAFDPIERKARRPLPEFTGLPVAEVEGTDSAYIEFLPIAQQIVRRPPAMWRRYLAYLICGLITAALLWSIFGYLRLFAIAPGEVEAQGGNQVVQPTEAGQISAIPVANGTHVAKDAIVLELDPTSAKAAKTIIESKLTNARAEQIRRRTAATAAEAATIDKATTIAWPDNIPADVRAREESVLQSDLAQLAASLADLDAKLKAQEAERDKYAGSVEAQKTLIESRTKRTAMKETLAQQGWDSRAAVLHALEPLRQDQVNLANSEGELDMANATIPVLQLQMTQTRKSFIAENVDAAALAERQAADLEQELAKASLTLKNLTLRAPVAGTVQSLAVTTTGQWVKPGDKVMQIVPDNVPLDIKAYVLNNDIGFVRAGQKVTIKVDTFPYTRYGTLSGRVVSVGADAITGRYAIAQQRDDATTPSKGSLSASGASQVMKDLVFPVLVSLDQTTIRVDGRDAPLTPGMSIVAEIETQRQRAITYILYPLSRVFLGARSKE